MPLKENLLKPILEAINQEPALTAGRQVLQDTPDKPIHFFGLNPVAKALVTLALESSTSPQQPMVYIAPDILALRAIASTLEALTGTECVCFEPTAQDLFATGVKNHEEEIRRLFILSGFSQKRIPLLLTTAEACLNDLPDPEQLKKDSIRLRLGDEPDREALIQQLSDLGYERTREVEAPGQFAVRGEVMDIGFYLTQPVPGIQGHFGGLRLSFFDTEIENLKWFDVHSQRSVENQTQVVIPPVREVMSSPEKRQHWSDQIQKALEEGVAQLLRQGGSRQEAERLREAVEEDRQKIAEGLDFAGINRWKWLMNPDSVTLLDHAQKIGALLILEEPLTLRSRLEAAEAASVQEMQELILKGRLLPEVAEHHRSPVHFFQQLDQTDPKVVLADLQSSGNGLPGGESWSLRTQAPETYRGREAILREDLQKWQKNQWKVLLCVPGEQQKSRLREWLNETSLTLPVEVLSLNEGALFPQAGVALLGSVNLFGQTHKKLKGKREGEAIRYFKDLHVGELVVHEVHGIGRYLGLETLVTEGARRDYLKIEYAESDSLYIPVDRLEEISRYVGGDSAKPKLTRLGSSEWENKKAKARSSIRKLATNLLAVYARRKDGKGFAFSPDTVWNQEFEESFPFEDTPDQVRAMKEIKSDMESDQIMDRLLCGDVGFGKTELAFRALLKAVMDGKQGALLVPTTVLAQQHYQTLLNRLGALPVRVRLLSRFVTGDARKKALADMREGNADILIGTHRALSKDVAFKDLGLLVIDEEQRFGVDHKETLKERYPGVDVLTMTATPIPRTLHLSMTGIRDISILESGPDDRRAVQTYVMEMDPGIVDEAILREIQRGGQVFYLYNDTRRIASKARELQERLPGIRVTYAHGKMNEKTLEEALQSFMDREVDVLCCTTIIESGIDMPNVNTMIVENAEKLGLAQLYQIRGRVGRSQRQAYAYITYRPDKVLNEDARKRLAAIRDFTELGSGFQIAMRDLEVRGAGNLLGGEQSGHLDSIGYDLYCRMLEEEINRLKGAEVPISLSDCVVDIPMDAMIPSDYIEDEGQRMDLYRRALVLRNGEDWRDITDELIDRYGDLPQAVENMLDLSLARHQAALAGIERISLKGQDLVFSLAEGKTMNEALFNLMQKDTSAGKLILNAGQKGFLTLPRAVQSENAVGGLLRQLFLD